MTGFSFMTTPRTKAFLLPGFRSPSLELRLWGKVRVGPATECWEWLTTCYSNGYGQFRMGEVSKCAHRVAWELANGPIQAGLEIDHTCLNKRCVNPHHLEPVTPRENMLRAGAGSYQSRRTHCPKGHAYTPDNTYVQVWGKNRTPKRSCKACRLIKNKLNRSR